MTEQKKEQRYGIEVSMYDKANDDNRICFFGVGQRFTFKAPQDYCGMGIGCNYTPVDSSGEYGDVSEETLKDGHSYVVRCDGMDEHGNEIIRAVDFNDQDEDYGQGSLPLGVTAITAMLLIGVQMFMPANALADAWTDPNTNYTWEYQVIYGGVRLTKGPDAKDSIAIPSELGGHSLTEIGDGAFRDHNNISEVTIPSSVTTICGAFKGCTNLTHISLPDGIETIGGEAFAGCSSLEKINLPDGIETIGEEAFAGCSSLEKINFPKSIRRIRQRAFEKCVELKSAQFNNAEQVDLSGGVFADCTKLESVSFLGEGIVDLYESVFRGCTNLKSITVNTNCSAIRCYKIKLHIILRIIFGKQVFEIRDFDFSRLHTGWGSYEWMHIKNRIPYCDSGDELVSKFPATSFCNAHPALYKDFCAGASEAWCKQRESEMREKGERCDARFEYDEKLGILTHVVVSFESPGVSVKALEAKYKKKTQKRFMERLISRKPRRAENTVYIDNGEISVSGEINSGGKVDEITIRSRKLDAALAERDRKENEAKTKAEADAARKKEANALNF